MQNAKQCIPLPIRVFQFTKANYKVKKSKLTSNVEKDENYDRDFLLSQKVLFKIIYLFCKLFDNKPCLIIASWWFFSNFTDNNSMRKQY